MSLMCIIVDDQPTVCRYLACGLQKRYGDLIDVYIFTDTSQALTALNPSVDLLIMDYEMPGIDGRSFLAAAVAKGVPRSRIIILSSHDPDSIRKTIPLGKVLAVINKSDKKQQEALTMILDAAVKRSRVKRPFKDADT